MQLIQWPVCYKVDLDLFYIPINSKTATTLLYWLKHWTAHVVASNVAILYMRSKFPLAVLSNTDVILTKEASHSCRFVPGTNWYKWASQIVNFTLILHFGLSDNLAWPVVSVCSLMFATSKRLLQSFTFIFYYNSDLFKIFLYFSRHFNKMQSFTFIFYYISDLFKIFSLNFKTF